MLNKDGLEFFKDRKGEILFPVVMFIVLNLIFFSMLLFFVYKASLGALVYEQAYSKEIALMLDGAKPGMQFKIDFTKGLEVAEKNKWTGAFVQIKDNSVVVSLDKRGGYTMNYFTDYKVGVSYEEKFLVLEVMENV